MKACSKCQKVKPLSEFYPRKISKDGHRGVCIPCWLEQHRASKREYYQRHGERIRAERRAYREANPEKEKRRNFLDYWRHKDKKNAYSHAYYRQHADRLIAMAIERRRRKQSLDYGWTKDLAHDRIQFDVWQTQQTDQQAAEILSDLMDNLCDRQQAFLIAMLNADSDVAEASRLMGWPMAQGEREMEAIRHILIGR